VERAQNDIKSRALGRGEVIAYTVTGFTLLGFVLKVTGKA
jgi:hypothetical protein